MKLTFLKYRTKLLLKNNKTVRNSVPYASSKTAGVIFTVEDKQKHFAVKDFIKHLEDDGKHVQVLEFLPEKTENYEFRFDYYTEKDVNFWGQVNSSTANQFADAPFDYLFYLDFEPNPIVMNLLAKSKAKCRVGRYWEDGNPYLDFMISAVGSTKSLMEGIYRYIHHIR